MPRGGRGPRHCLSRGRKDSVQRHTAQHIVDILPFVQILDVLVPQLGDRVVDLLREIGAPALVEQVIAVPKISLDRVPQRSAVRCTQMVEQLVEVPTELGYALAVLASIFHSRREVRVFSLDRVQLRLAQRS